MAPEPRRTVLFDVLRRAGAEFVEWEGWLWADHFGDPLREHHAVRRDVGLWDLSPLGALLADAEWLPRRPQGWIPAPPKRPGRAYWLGSPRARAPGVSVN